MSSAVFDKTYLPPRSATGEADLDAEFQQICEQFSHIGARPDENVARLVIGTESITVPREMMDVLVQVSKAMSQGLAVSVVPHNLMVSTQEAADILGISRPTLVRMLEEKRIPYERANRHRRLYLSDVVKYRERQRRASHEALADMVADSQLLDDYSFDPAEVVGALAEVRKGH